MHPLQMVQRSFPFTLGVVLDRCLRFISQDGSEVSPPRTVRFHKNLGTVGFDRLVKFLTRTERITDSLKQLQLPNTHTPAFSFTESSPYLTPASVCLVFVCILHTDAPRVLHPPAVVLCSVFTLANSSINRKQTDYQSNGITGSVL